MASSVKPIPDGYHSVTPYLIAKGAAQAIEYYKTAFGAMEHLRLEGPDGSIGHAEIKIGDSLVMIADEHPDYGAFGPAHFGGSPVKFCIYVENVDAVFEQALAVGGEVVRPIQDQFYGDRTGTLRDPFGHEWTFSTHVEDVSQEEVQRRFDEMSQAAG